MKAAGLFEGTVTLTAGLNRLRTLVEAAMPADTIFPHLWLREVTYRVKSGGPVDKGSAAMSVIGDGTTYGVGGGDTETGPIDIGSVYFFASNTGDRLFLRVRALNP